MTTPAIAAIRADVTARFPDVVDGGTTNVRKVAGTDTWSQHAYGNAWDIFGPGRSAGAADQRYLDQVYRYLSSNRRRLNIDELIWKHHGGGDASAHQDHIHVSARPRMTGDPNAATPTIGPTTGLGPIDDLLDKWDGDGTIDGLREGAAGAIANSIRVQVALARGLSFLTDPKSWHRVGLVAGGVVLALVGVALLIADQTVDTAVDVGADALLSKGAGVAGAAVDAAT